MSKIVSMDTALDLIRDGAVVGTSGFMIAGTPESVFRAMGERYAQTGHPRDLTCVFCASQGNAEGQGYDHLAQDGMVVVVVSMSGEDGALVSGPDIITRGFVYVKESEGLMDELRQVALDAILDVDTRYATDWSAIKQSIKADLSNYLYKKTKRSPMILPVIMEV